MSMISDHAGTVPAAAAPERRATGRRRVLRGATLTFNHGFGSFECLVRNESQHGARLTFGDASAVPAHFELAVAGEAVRRGAHVRWRTMTAIGVEYD